MTRPLPARLVLLAAAAALAGLLVLAMVIAESRDGDDAPPPRSGAIEELRVEGIRTAPAEQLRLVPAGSTE